MSASSTTTLIFNTKPLSATVRFFSKSPPICYPLSKSQLQNTMKGNNWRPSGVGGLGPKIHRVIRGGTAVVAMAAAPGVGIGTYELFQFLGNEEYTFVGFGIGNDLEKLEADYGLEVSGNIVDLRGLAADAYEMDRLNGAGLKILARVVLDREIEKPRQGSWRMNIQHGIG